MAAGYLNMGRPSPAPSEGALASAGAWVCVGDVRERVRERALVGRYSFLSHVCIVFLSIDLLYFICFTYVFFSGNKVPQCWRGVQSAIPKGGTVPQLF